MPFVLQLGFFHGTQILIIPGAFLILIAVGMILIITKFWPHDRFQVPRFLLILVLVLIWALGLYLSVIAVAELLYGWWYGIG